MKLSILSGGAAAGVVKGLQAQFEEKYSCQIETNFSAVGAMRDLLLAGETCDLVILTRSMIEGLIQSGHVEEGSIASLGIVRTGVAIKTGDPIPAIANREQLLKAFNDAGGIYFPDPEKATAGIHVYNVLKQLGLEKIKEAALHIFPNGATAMAAMAASSDTGLIGSTQVTEINITPGVQLVGMLPKEFELATDYCLGICTQGQSRQLVVDFANLLTGTSAATLRQKIGFELN
jgi:molybdate transport system substrate-binding protein